MFNLFRDKKINAFGIDISDISIKVMQLSRQDGRIFPNAYKTSKLPGNIISNHLIVNQDKLADQIRRTVASSGDITSKYVVASVPEAKSFVRMVSIPRMNMEDIDGALPWELEQDIPIPIDQVYMDWQLISETDEKFNLLVMSSPRDYIDSLSEALKLAGLKPVAFELESQATARSVIGPEDMDEPVLILDMSTTQTSFVIVEGGNLMYTSSIPIAGNAFTESIARNFGVTSSEAEKMKKEIGLKGETKKGNIRQAILPILDNVIDEIRNVVRFYEEHAENNAKITKVYLCGGSSRLSGLAEYISARMNLGAGRPFGRVGLANIWINVLEHANDTLPMSQDDSLEYATVMGLALRGISL